jgi:hypothetical protein
VRLWRVPQLGHWQKFLIINMSIEEFLEKLKTVKDKYNWVLVQMVFSCKVIRTQVLDISGEYVYVHCPITAIYEGETKSNGYVQRYGREMGLSEADTTKIVKAADSDLFGYDKDLRHQMLEILGLNE